MNSVALSLVYVEIKNWAVRKIPYTQEFKEAWSEWEVRCLVLLSLTLQILLILSAYGRQIYKGRFSPYVAAIVWSIYLAADWVATLSMTTILRSTFEKESAVVVLWVPFLLWHLGSPANITAYSLEDNELWLRHFLGLVSNGAEAVYVYVKFRTAGAAIYGSLNYFDLMVIPLLIGGILKYAERIVALRSASSEQLRSALYSEAELNQVISKGKGMIRTGMYESGTETAKQFVESNVMDPHVKFLREAHMSFEIFRPLFLDLPFKVSNKYNEDMVFLKDKSAEEAFRLVNIELQFLYDMFFTKNPIQHRHRKLNALLRGFYILSALSVLIAFSTQNNIGMLKRDLSGVDIIVTYMLLVGAIFLDAFAARLHIWSYWSMSGFGIKTRGKLHKFYCWLVASRLRSIKSKTRIPKLAQYDVLKDFCLTSKEGIFSELIKLVDTNELRNKHRLISWVEVDRDLKEFIYNGLKNELNGSLLNNVLKGMLSDLDASLWPYGKSESNQRPAGLTRSVFICHITTKLIYYRALNQRRPVGSSLCRICNILSDYMVYLVLVNPTMLPKDFGDMTKESFVPDKKRPDLIRKESYAIASAFFPGFGLNPTAKATLFATGLLAIEDLDIFFSFKFNSLDNSLTPVTEMNPAVLIQGHEFAKKLLGLRNMRFDDDDIWELLSDMWMKMLIHAAKHCSWKEHALVTRNGGELLTYVSLLLAHFGLSYYIHVEDVTCNDYV